MPAELFIHAFTDGLVLLWHEGGVHIKTNHLHGGLIELPEKEACHIANALLQSAKSG